MTNTLNTILKKQGTLVTNIGDFKYVKQIGEGGNSLVYEYKYGDFSFAIKFLKLVDDDKIRRFKDEYFCAMQMPSHELVVQIYHFDKVICEESEYFIIIMKYYDTTLHALGPNQEIDDEEKSKQAWKLFWDIGNALDHLHTHGVIHRDIKPQNIFYNKKNNSFVIGDLGIAHFAEENFPKQAETKKSDRLANYLFSAPEQADSKSTVTPASDFYAFGQIIQWYLTGKVNRGTGRAPLGDSHSVSDLRYLDTVVHKCLSNDQANRFQSFEEIKSLIHKLKTPKRHITQCLNDLDLAIRSSFPQINEIYSTQKEIEISRFLTKFSVDCDPSEFYWMDDREGDSQCSEFIKIGSMKWLFGLTELLIDKLIIYRSPGAQYKSFFVLIIAADKPFQLTDSAGNIIIRKIDEEWREEHAVFRNERYIAGAETRNGYYDDGDSIIKVNATEFQDRFRKLKRAAYIVVPQGSASAIMNDRKPTGEFVRSALVNSEINKDAFDVYQRKIQSKHSVELTLYD